jgi:hypothetical protein
MYLTALLGTVAVYILLAILLLSLNIFSLWKWWIKAGAIIVTTLGFVATYLLLNGLVGWPTVNKLPPRFSLVATRIVEPDKARGAPGHIYLWVEEIDEHQIPVTPPRGYEVAFTNNLAKKTDEAQQLLKGGQKVLGQVQGGNSDKEGKVNPSATPSPQSTPSEIGQSNRSGQAQTGNSAGAETLTDAANITFSDMPPVDLPDKDTMIIGQ